MRGKLSGTRPKVEESPEFRRRIEWQREDGMGGEEFHLFEFDDAIHWMLNGSVVLKLDGTARWVRYMVGCDANWHTQIAYVALAKHLRDLERFPQVKSLIALSVDENNTWSVGERERSDLHGCLDIDLGFTPSTNTLPIRRLNLAVGESADVTAAWVRFPELSVQPLRQRYTRTAADRYRYESLDSGFTAELTVDDLGLVVDYPGGWRRLAQ